MQLSKGLLMSLRVDTTRSVFIYICFHSTFSVDRDRDGTQESGWEVLRAALEWRVRSLEARSHTGWGSICFFPSIVMSRLVLLVSSLIERAGSKVEAHLQAFAPAFGTPFYTSTRVETTLLSKVTYCSLSWRHKTSWNSTANDFSHRDELIWYISSRQNMARLLVISLFF